MLGDYGHVAHAMSWWDGLSNAAGGIGFQIFMVFLITSAFLACCAFIYFGELYREAPGWGPIVKFDSDGSEELRINQLLMRQHSQMAQVGSSGAKKGGGGEVSEFESTSGVHIEGYGTNVQSYKVPGPSVGVPDHKFVWVRPGFHEEMEKQFHRDDVPRDEIEYRRQTGTCSRKADPHDYEEFSYRIV